MSKPIIIEVHDNNGVHWGISFDGYNPEAAKYIEVKDSATAERITILCEIYAQEEVRKEISKSILSMP